MVDRSIECARFVRRVLHRYLDTSHPVVHEDESDKKKQVKTGKKPRWKPLTARPEQNFALSECLGGETGR